MLAEHSMVKVTAHGLIIFSIFLQQVPADKIRLLPMLVRHLCLREQSILERFLPSPLQFCFAIMFCNFNCMKFGLSLISPRYLINHLE